MENVELDLRIFASRILGRWKFILLYLAAAFTIVVIAGLIYASTTHKIMRQDIRLFGISERYPNAIGFNKSDFLAPEILKELFESTGLTQFDPEEYADIVSVAISRRGENAIHAKYDAQIAIVSEGKKSAENHAEIVSLIGQRNQEVADLNKNNITLQIDYEKYGIDKGSAQIVLDAWPKIWERIVVVDYRVITDLSLNSMTLITDTDLSIPENAYYARRQLDFVRGNLAKFSNDPRFKKLISTKGRTPIEVLRGIDEFDQVLFTPLYSSVLSIDTPLSEFYLADQTLSIEVLDKQIASLQSIVDDVAALEVNGREKGKAPRDTGDIIQIGDGTLDDIVGLVQKASLQDFLTTTLNRRHELVVAKAAIEKNLAQVAGNTLLTENFFSTTSKIYRDIIAEYGDLLLKADGQAHDSRLALFEPLGDAPLMVGGRTHPKMKIWGAIPASGLLLLLMIFVCIPRKSEVKNGSKNI